MLTGVILAGGQNRRMNGKMKALLSIHGETIVERQIKEMEQECQEIFIITHLPEMFLQIAPAHVRLLSDVIPGQGPLSGIHTALSHASFPYVWIVAGDMPFISSQVARCFLHEINHASYDAILPHIMGQIHPLHAIYHKRCLPTIADFLEQGKRKVTQWIKKINYKRFNDSFFQKKGIELDFVTNINTPEDYEILLQKKKKSSSNLTDTIG